MAGRAVFKMWVPVRCCCTPQKVFGFLRMSQEHMGVDIYAVVDKSGHWHELRLRDFGEGGRVCSNLEMAYSSIPPDFAARPAALERAVYSDDRPLSFWRSIPGFIEASNGVE